MGESVVTSTKKRIDTIDVLRGFALAGILYAHMIIWYTGAALPEEVYFSYNSTADYVSFAIFGAFVFGKFFSVFSFLFGLGFYLHFSRNESGSGFSRVYLWRLCLLFIIGILHHTLWRGDILAIYAILGIALLIFRQLPSKAILLISFLLITNLPVHLYELFFVESAGSDLSLPMELEAEAYYALVKDGNFITNLKENWGSWPAKLIYQLESGRLLITFGYFLLGFYAGRTKLFSSIGKNIKKFYRWNRNASRVILVLLVVALLMLLMDYVTLPRIEVVPQLKWLASFLFSIYNVCFTIFYITGITILFRKKYFNTLLKPFAAMGRMALTNYLLQTLFGLVLFYDFGFGLFFETSPALNILLGIAIFYLQLKFSQWWLKNYKQGPVEWLWRSLTYFKFGSIKKRKGTAILEETEAI